MIGAIVIPLVINLTPNKDTSQLTTIPTTESASKIFFFF
jgi:hypothetical protein